MDECTLKHLVAIEREILHSRLLCFKDARLPLPARCSAELARCKRLQALAPQKGGLKTVCSLLQCLPMHMQAPGFMKGMANAPTRTRSLPWPPACIMANWLSSTSTHPNMSGKQDLTARAVLYRRIHDKICWCLRMALHHQASLPHPHVHHYCR